VRTARATSPAFPAERARSLHGARRTDDRPAAIDKHRVRRTEQRPRGRKGQASGIIARARAGGCCICFSQPGGVRLYFSTARPPRPAGDPRAS
jgi:hypothetical protein